MSARWVSVIVAVAIVPALADEVLYRYEGDVLPYDPSAGWLVGNPCEGVCSESLEDGHFKLLWTGPTDPVLYHYTIAHAPDPAPPTLWIEWRFRSNHPMPPHSYTCDAEFAIDHGTTEEAVQLYGDAAISFLGDQGIIGFDIASFHTYRYESSDGVNYRISMDGVVFIVDDGVFPDNGYSYMQFGGRGGCSDDWIPNMVNEWDYIRFGTIADDERIVATDPPEGYLDPDAYPNLDRFSVTFSAPNNISVNQIAVEVTGGVPPRVEWVLRHEDFDDATVEIVLDRPIAAGETTTFRFPSTVIGAEFEAVYTVVDVEACCFPEGSCANLPVSACAAGGGGPLGENTTCVGDPDQDGYDGSCGDNCPSVANPGQEDCNGDGEGDACDPDAGEVDSDGDGVCNNVDNCLDTPNPEQGDEDGDTVGDACDRCPDFDDLMDVDDNGIPDCLDPTVIIVNGIPTLSGWGVIVLTLLLLTAAKLAYRSRRAPCPNEARA
ncbi:MAG: thrombospondin type 3 repeat-containing protein [Planctomycetes bacterium]|nr:thrombospondin type 3 repeat-containing protein [Planctomycetota bacterium]